MSIRERILKAIEQETDKESFKMLIFSPDDVQKDIQAVLDHEMGMKVNVHPIKFNRGTNSWWVMVFYPLIGNRKGSVYFDLTDRVDSLFAKNPKVVERLDRVKRFPLEKQSKILFRQESLREFNKKI